MQTPPQSPERRVQSFDINALSHLRILTMLEVCAITTYTPTHIYRLERQGKFPRRRRIGPNRIGFLLSEIEAWMASRPLADISDESEE
jgi:prophage regulatory protein